MHLSPLFKRSKSWITSKGAQLKRDRARCLRVVSFSLHLGPRAGVPLRALGAEQPQTQSGIERASNIHASNPCANQGVIRGAETAVISLVVCECLGH